MSKLIRAENDSTPVVSSGKPEKKEGTAFRLLIRIVLAATAVALLGFSFFRIISSTKDAYNTAKEDARDSAYDFFYQSSFASAEAKLHVANRISVSIESVVETAKLEVLRVSDVEYVIQDGSETDDKITSWLSVPGYGVFTVDLAATEFLVDSRHQYVLIRVPKPVLSDISVDYRNIEKLFWKKDRWFSNGNIQEGEELAQAQVLEGQRALEQYISSNRLFYQGARDASENMLIALVKQLNPNIPDLKVEVEFIEIT